MLAVISPAKRLNEKPAILPEGLFETAPEFAKEAAKLAKVARGLSAADLCKLMDISPALGQLNFDRFKAFATSTDGFLAAFLFDGDTYAGLEARTMEPDSLRWAQQNLRILSGLYGVLRPLDVIKPYRLEMGSKLANPKGADLYAYWGKSLSKTLNDLAVANGAQALVNCASTEYFGAVHQPSLKISVITPVFLEERDGEAKIISFWAKKARGSMARFICDNHLTDPADLRSFDLGGYTYRPDQSDSRRFVFSREAPNLAAA